MTGVSLLLSNLTKWGPVYRWLLSNTSWTYETLQLMTIVGGWMTLKCVSFAMDAQTEKEEKKQFSLSHFLGYLFYLPTLYLGPPIIYSRFRTCYEKEAQRDLSGLFKTFLKDIGKVILWYHVLEFSHHILYVSSLKHNLDILEKFSTVSLFGYGLLMGQHFHVKYVVLYGFSCAFAKLDGINAPPLPICVARVHKYSNMWKHFDRGLYEFLIK